MKTEKKKGYLLLLFALISVIVIMLDNLAKLGIPLYKKIYYGTLTDIFVDVAKILIYIIAIITLTTISRKKLNFKAIVSKNKTVLPLKRLFSLTIIVTAIILYISWKIGWNIKPIYDLGEHFTGHELRNYAVGMLKDAIKIVLMFMAIRFFQEGMEILLEEKSKFPWGGLFLAVTLGTFELISKVHYLSITYFYLYIIFGILYLLTNRNTKNTYLLMLLIYYL